MPEPSCCSRPEPWEPPRVAEGRRDLIDCMEDESRNGTDDDVFGIDPWTRQKAETGDGVGIRVPGGRFGRGLQVFDFRLGLVGKN